MKNIDTCSICLEPRVDGLFDRTRNETHDLVSEVMLEHCLSPHMRSQANRCNREDINGCNLVNHIKEVQQRRRKSLFTDL